VYKSNNLYRNGLHWRTLLGKQRPQWQGKKQQPKLAQLNSHSLFVFDLQQNWTYEKGGTDFQAKLGALLAPGDLQVCVSRMFRVQSHTVRWLQQHHQHALPSS
jgi:hypothetical protein